MTSPTGPAHKRPRWHQLARRRVVGVEPLVWLLLADLALSVATLAVVADIAAALGAAVAPPWRTAPAAAGRGCRVSGSGWFTLCCDPWPGGCNRYDS